MKLRLNTTVIVIFALLLGVGVIAYMSTTKNEEISDERYSEQAVAPFTGVCDVEIFNAAIVAMNENDYVALSETIPQLTQSADFQSSVDCVYVATYYSLMDGDAENAKTYFTELQNVQETSGQTYNNALTPYVLSNEDIQNLIQKLESDDTDSQTKAPEANL